MTHPEHESPADTPTGHFEIAPLEAWMKDHVEGFRGPIEVEKFPGGQSNPTFCLTTPEKQYVLRRKPPGKIFKGAHAVEREYRIMSALGPLGFPVPRTYGLCEDDEVIGTPFFIMDMVEGRIFWDPTFPEVPLDERRAYYDSMCDTIAQLHEIDYVAAGLEDYGKPHGFIERQIALWSRQYQADEEAGRIDEMDRLVEWLPKNIPDDDGPTSIIHGDYRCDNLMFHPTEPRVIAVLDWELSTLGHPLSDFAYHLMSYRMPSGLSAGMGGLDIEALGLPGEAEYTAAYCQKTGRSDIPDLDFYFAFNMFRLAAIIHGVKGRMLRGTASSAQADQLVGKLEILAKTAWRQAQKAGA